MFSLHFHCLHSYQVVIDADDDVGGATDAVVDIDVVVDVVVVAAVVARW